VTARARELAEWGVSLRYADIPPDVLKLNGLRLLDSLGLIVAGRKTQAVKIARELAAGWGGKDQSTLLGTAVRVPCASAALVHGTAAHCFDFDDTFAESVVHPGSFVIPTALAAAEAYSASDEDFAVALTLGYEIAARLGKVAERRFHARSLHASAVVGPIAAAVVASRLMSSSAERMSWSMGLAASMSGGLRAYAIDGGWSKWLHLGWAAHGGIIAAELASRGFRGPEFVFDGELDLYSSLLHGESVDRSSLLAALGERWESTSCEFKYYPCAHVIQPFVDAVLSLMKEHHLVADDIDGVECVIAPWAAAIVCEPREAKLRFRTELEATGSLPYQISCAVLDGRLDLGSLTPECRSRDDVTTFCRRVTHRADDTLGRRFDGIAKVTTKAGTILARTASLPNASTDRLAEKFNALVAGALEPSRARQIAEMLTTGPTSWREVVVALQEVGPD
jgi:2-methylcitrate dehydratase PrpD